MVEGLASRHPLLPTPKMKTLVSLLAGTLGLAFAATATPTGPEGVAASDWADIRVAYEAGRHAPQRQEGGHLVARNPGQQWRTEFDGKGFTVTPDHGNWTWGLELTGYGNRTLPSAASPSQPRHEGAKIICRHDENLTEWFVNDSRGLEQGWDIRQRPERADPSAPLQLHLATRGDVRPEVAASGDSVSFLQESGGRALSYGGLKAWDAEGKKLAVRFERAEGKGIRIAVEDQSARYPITIDPVAQQTELNASNAGLADYFGLAVAISGDTAVVGAPFEDGEGDNPASNLNTDSGAVYVFTRRGGAWSQQAYLKASNNERGDRFGNAVAISGSTIVVGAMKEGSSATGVNGDQWDNTALGSGAAYVFVRNGTTWTQQAYLKAHNGEGGYLGFGDLFGISVAIDGNTVVVGADDEDSAASGVNGNGSSNGANGAGAAYVFVRNNATWTQQAYLKASNPDPADTFGAEVGVSGDTVIVGSPRERSAATGVNGDQTSNTIFGAGAVYVFTREGTGWSQQAYLKASNTRPVSSGSGSLNSMFGDALAISGDTIVVGADGEESPSSGVNADQTQTGSINSGAAYIFTRSGTTWTQQAFIKASNSVPSLNFGSSVAIAGDTMVAGASGHQGASGAAYVFKRNGTTWTETDFLKPSSDLKSGDYFGTSVGVSGDFVIAGAFRPTLYIDFKDTYFTGSSYVYRLNPEPLLVEEAGKSIAGGATKDLGLAVTGGVNEISLDLFNLTAEPLNLTGNPKVAVSGSSDFSVALQPASPLSDPAQGSLLMVRFAPTSGGPKTATLSIPHDGPEGSPFVLHLTGTGLSYTTDTDGDGMDDATEFTMAGLNFNWQVSQTDLVDTYLASLDGGGLYTAAQIQAIYPETPLIAKDQASGRFKLTTHWKKSTHLAEFFDFPAPEDSSVSISPAGKIEFEFTSPESAAFFRINQD